MELCDKIKILRKELKLNQTDIAEQLGIGLSSYQNYERGERDVPSSVIKQIMLLYGVTPDWLFSSDDTKMTTKRTIQSNEYMEIPLVQGRIAAGCGLMADDAVETYLSFRTDWIKRKGDPQNMSLIRVEGDSMEHTLSSGDVVLVDHSRNYIGGDSIYAISVDDHSMIKRLMPIGDKVQIISDNDKYPPFMLPSSEVIINGTVIWYGHELKG